MGWDLLQHDLTDVQAPGTTPRIGMEGPSQWSEADTKKARMVQVYIISHVNLPSVSAQGSSAAWLKMGIFSLPHPQGSSWQRRPKIWYSSVPAPWGRMPLRDWVQRNCQTTKQNKCFVFCLLQIIHVSKSLQRRLWGHCVRTRTNGEQPWGETTFLDPVCSHPQSPKHRLWFRGVWGRVGILHPKAPIPQPGVSQRSAATQGLTRILSPCTAFLPACWNPLTELALEICALCYVGGRKKKKRKEKHEIYLISHFRIVFDI